MSVSRTILQICAGVIGTGIALFAVFEILLFLNSTAQEAESARQYGGHPSFLGGVGAALVILVLAGLAGLISFYFIRYAARGDKPN
jgi:hypothetical protein